MKLIINALIIACLTISCAHVSNFGKCEWNAIEQSAKDMVIDALSSPDWRSAMAKCVNRLGTATVNCIVDQILSSRSASVTALNTTVRVNAKLWQDENK